jgi:2-polyprenyl-3-methyl-5-hydroxy-6-metoxy-1,4-benzoquinol methylase
MPLPRLPLKQRFVTPPLVTLEGYQYLPGYETYTAYNYLRAGRIASRVKRLHFEMALALTADHFGRARVVDFGCGDGPFLPSLARYFPEVVGVEARSEFAKLAERVVAAARLDNARVLCNAGQSFAEIAGRAGGPFDLVFLLEVLEHIGSRDRLYESKLEFLDGLTQFLKPGGLLVVSVPRMVGLPFLVQRLGLWALRLHREPISLRQLARAVVFSDTEELEPHWVNDSHLGFNEKKLLRFLRTRYEPLKTWDGFFQVAYLLRPR